MYGVLSLLLLLNTVWFVSAQGDEAEKLKQKWSLESVIRDVEHIKEDMQSLMHLTELGEIKESEMLFFLIRMHDFDNNGGLDGIELRAALLHKREHLKELEHVHLDVEPFVDELLKKMDSDNNGIIDYGEFRLQK